MTVFTDHKSTVDIKLRNWNHEKQEYEPDFSADFYEIGGLKNVADAGESPVYEVEDIDYLIDYAQSMIDGTNPDFDDPSPETELFITNLDSKRGARSLNIYPEELTNQESGITHVEGDQDEMFVGNWKGVYYSGVVRVIYGGKVNILDYFGDREPDWDDNDDYPSIGKGDEARLWTLETGSDVVRIVAPFGWV